MNRSDIPTIEECEALYDEFHVLSNVREHLRAVAKCSKFLAQKLKEKNIDIDEELVDRAGRVHDIFKFVDFDSNNINSNYSLPTEEDIKVWNDVKNKYPDMDHEEITISFFKEKYPKLSKVLEGVGYLTIKDSKTWEQKIVYYADMCVMHNKIVNVKKRLEDGMKRFSDRGNKKHKVVDLTEEILQLEKEIFDILDIEPQHLEELNNE